MNLRDLKYIVSVAELGSFNKAAEACHISQPALSIQIKKIEDVLNVKIFERHKKKFLVTPSGEKLVEKAREILQKADQFNQIAKAAADPYSGRVNVGAFPTLAPYYFPKILPRITEKFPKLKFYLIEEKTADILQALKKGELDFAFLATPINEDNIEVRGLFDDPFLVAVPKNNKLAAKKKIKRSDLKDEKLLLLEEGHCLRDQALEFCELLGSGEVQDFRATSLETLRQMVATGNGITLIPQIAINDDKHLKYISFEANAPSRRIAMVWRRTNPRAEVFRKIADVIGWLHDGG